MTTGPHRIILLPSLDDDGRHRHSSRGPLYDVQHEGQPIIAGTPLPFYDGARALQLMGLAGQFEMWRCGGTAAAMRGDIDKAADFTIREDDSGPRLVKWISFAQRQLPQQRNETAGGEVASNEQCAVAEAA
jgi:hypothetical protein